MIAIRHALDELIEAVGRSIPELSLAVQDEVLGRMDVVREVGTISPEHLRETIEENLRHLFREFLDPGAAADDPTPTETGRRLARQGVPLPEILAIYRIGMVRLWELLIEMVRSSSIEGGIDALVDVSAQLLVIVDRHASQVTVAYREASADLLISDTRRRAALVESLLTGETAGAPPWRIGKLLGLPVDTDLAVVVAATTELGNESLTGIERRLSDVGSVSAWQLTPHVQRGVVAIGDDEQRRAVLAVLHEVATTPTGVSPPYRSLRDTPWALHLARTAQAAGPVKPEVREFSSSPLAAMVAHDPDEGRRLADAVLGRVLALPDEERSGLLSTVEAYLAHAGSTDRVAETLGCHPNTVRNRLRRVRDLTGRSVDDPRQTAELAAALDVVRFSSDFGPRGPGV